MIGHAMAARSRARYLAPLALAATIAGMYVVVHAATSTNKTTTTTLPALSNSPAARRHRHFARVRFYTVKPGDSLTSIATKTGVALNILEALNPSIDPNALQTGQRIRLRR
jgi:N-acetylmuramoyl-L-alanine amidase